jgi:AraC-like DNA-binding protein
VRNANVVCDDALFLPSFDRKGHTDRPVISVVLAGRARMRAFGTERWLEPGDVTFVQSKSAVVMRQEGQRYEAVAIEWDPGCLGGALGSSFVDGKLNAVDLGRLREATTPFAEEDLTGAAMAAARLLHVLRAAGAPFDAHRAGDLVEPVPTRTRFLARALDAVLSDLDARPAASDLDRALGLSERQLQRIVSAYNARYGFNSHGWRDTRNRRRLMVGAALMTSPGATTDLVRAATGYGSASSFCHAFAQVGMVSPGAVAEIVEQLR